MLVAAAGCTMLPLPRGVSFPHSLEGSWKGRARLMFTSGAAQDTLPVELSILRDGRVTGRVGGAELLEGRVSENKTWMGRFTYERADYIIVSDLDGEIADGIQMTGGHAAIPIEIDEDTVRGEIHVREREEEELTGTVISATDMRLTKR